MSDDEGVMSRSQVKVLEDEIERLKVNYWIRMSSLRLTLFLKKTVKDLQRRYAMEQRTMLQAVQTIGDQRFAEHLSSQGQQRKYGPTSWLARQRKNSSLITSL